MRDQRYIAEHRGGPLKKDQHRQLIQWAYDCVEHILPLFGEKSDERLEKALSVAKEWEKGTASVGEARKASVGAHELARELSDPASIAVARAVGHAVATAHMADHSLGAALYSLKAVKNAGKSVDAERKWQIEHLPLEIRELVLSSPSPVTRYPSPVTRHPSSVIRHLSSVIHSPFPVPRSLFPVPHFPDLPHFYCLLFCLILR